jgi:chromosome segregation ATPase
MSKAADLERELAELHSKYKGGDGEKESVNVIKKQRATIDKLKKDNDKLRDDMDLDSSLRASQSRAKTPADPASTMSTALSKLHDNAEAYTRKIESEKRKIEELDANIKDLNAVVLEQRKKLGGSNAVRENNTKTQKQIQVPVTLASPLCHRAPIPLPPLHRSFSAAVSPKAERQEGGAAWIWSKPQRSF